MIPPIVTVAPAIVIGNLYTIVAHGGDSPRDRGATVREYFLTLPLISGGGPPKGRGVSDFIPSV